MAKYENKTKQNKTKQNTLQCKSFTLSLGGNLRVATITLLFFFSFLVSPVIAQPPPPDLPAGYWENAYLGDAQIEGFQTFESAFWTIDFHESMGDCASAISFDAIMTIDGDVPNDMPITIELNSSKWQDNYELLVSTIKEEAGIENLPGIFNVSHIMFKLRVNGTLTGNEIYPNSNGWVTYPTGLPSPCQCISIYFDIVNRKLIVANFGC